MRNQWREADLQARTVWYRSQMPDGVILEDLPVGEDSHAGGLAWHYLPPHVQRAEWRRRMRPWVVLSVSVFLGVSFLQGRLLDPWNWLLFAVVFVLAFDPLSFYSGRTAWGFAAKSWMVVPWFDGAGPTPQERVKKAVYRLELEVGWHSSGTRRKGLGNPYEMWVIKRGPVVLVDVYASGRSARVSVSGGRRRDAAQFRKVKGLILFELTKRPEPPTELDDLVGRVR